VNQTTPPVSRILYLDPWAGASGDMVLSALLALQAPGGPLETLLREVVAGLQLPAVGLEVEEVHEGGFACRRVTVTAPSESRPRRLSDLEALLAAAPLSPSVRARSVAALRRLAEVEAGLHGVGVDEVHLHELGAADTVVDIVGVLSLFEALDVGQAWHGPVPLGSGRLEGAHGRMGLPAPATLALLHGVPVFGGTERMEVTTPTGALLLTELARPASSLPLMRPAAVGYGAGRRRLQGPNILRAVLGEVDSDPTASSRDRMILLETVLDDASPEVVAHAFRTLLAAGAVDVWTTALHMKKDRPGVQLTVLCLPADEDDLVDVLFRETTTFGVRRMEAERHVLAREWVRVTVQGEQIRVKLGRWRGEVTVLAPEYEDVATVAERSGRPLRVLFDQARAAAQVLVEASCGPGTVSDQG